MHGFRNSIQRNFESLKNILQNLPALLAIQRVRHNKGHETATFSSNSETSVDWDSNQSKTKDPLLSHFLLKFIKKNLELIMIK